MSKTRSIKRRRQMIATEDLMKLAGMSQLMVSVYQMPNGELLSAGPLLPQDEQTRVTYCILEKFAIQNGMTVQEYVFRVMNKHDAENEELRRAKGISEAEFKESVKAVSKRMGKYLSESTE